ncbi:MAG TPA: hypothetical protein VK694_08120 [Verrucomicrobiae bacterium]|nr:hypothetical protein [Verrucomicrobiae bacterium]
MIVAVVVLAVAFLALWFVNDRQTQTIKQLKSSVDWFGQNYLTRQGSHSEFGDYHLVSLDAGRNWFSATLVGRGTEDRQVIIDGPADPELLRRLRGEDALTAHINQHGPIDPSDPAQVRLLREAGFEVRPKR